MCVCLGVHREGFAFVATTTTTALPNNCGSLCLVVLCSFARLTSSCVLSRGCMHATHCQNAQRRKVVACCPSCLWCCHASTRPATAPASRTLLKTKSTAAFSAPAVIEQRQHNAPNKQRTLFFLVVVLWLLLQSFESEIVDGLQ